MESHSEFNKSSILY